MSVPVPPGLYTEPPRGAPALPDPTPQASDPTVLTTGQVIPRQTMPAVDVGDSFSVDLAAAPRVLRELRRARDDLIGMRREALALGKVDPGSNDDVSRDAASVFEAIAVGGRGSLLAAIDGGVRRIDDLVAAVESEMRAYRSTEDAQSARFDARP